jgi:hypothetical protein
MPRFALTEATKSTSAKRWVSDLLRRSGDSITYPCLVDLLRRGLRNGNWKHLDSGQKALFRCAMWIAKARGNISNAKLMVQVLGVALKMLQTVDRIERAGRRRATMMFQDFATPGGLFSWAPHIRKWLRDSKYVRYLGMMAVNA